VVSLLGVRWVIAYPEDCDWMAQALTFRVASETDTLCVIENPHPDPIFTLGPGIEVETIEEATTRIQARPWAAPPVVTPPDATVPEDGPPDARGLVAVLRAEADGVTLGTSSPAARWLLVRETWSRGWTATIDGAPVTIHPAAGTFFAVRVPKGPHRVVISYRTPGLRAGLAIAATWLGLVAVGAARARRRAPS
jgi:membrane protein YfhO